MSADASTFQHVHAEAFDDGTVDTAPLVVHTAGHPMR